MKKFKTFIACFLAAATLSGTFTCMPTAFATEAEIETETTALPVGIEKEIPDAYMTIYEYGNLDEVIKEHYGENSVIKFLNYGFETKDKSVYVLTEDYKIHLIDASYQRLVTMKKGTYPPVEKVRDLIHPNFYNPDFIQCIDSDSTYMICFRNDSPANEILLNDENVVSIEETFLVHEESLHSYSFDDIGQMECITGITTDELFDEYGDVFNLSVPIELESGYLPDGVYCELEKSEETYNALKKLFESDIDFVLSGKDCSSSNLGNEVNPDDLMAPAENYTIGDINEDGAVDLTDLSELSLAVLGDSTLSEEQTAAADIDGDNDLTVADLSRLKQYVSNQITSLR